MPVSLFHSTDSRNTFETKQRPACQSRQPERDRWLAEFEDTDGFTPVLREPSPLNPAQKKTTIEVKICADTDEQTYALCRSQQRIAKDRAIFRCLMYRINSVI
jgi:hypothetical protein